MTNDLLEPVASLEEIASRACRVRLACLAHDAQTTKENGLFEQPVGYDAALLRALILSSGAVLLAWPTPRLRRAYLQAITAG